MGKRLISVKDVQEAAEKGAREILAPAGQCIVTPMAMDEAESLGITITCTTGEAADRPGPDASRIIREVSRSVRDQLPVDIKARDVEETVRKIVRKKLSAQSKSGTEGPAGHDAARMLPVEKDKLISKVMAAVRDRLPAPVNGQRLEEVVREAVAFRLTRRTQEQVGYPAGGPSRVRLISGRDLFNTERGLAKTDGQAFVTEVLSGAGAGIAAGYMEWEESTFNRTVEYPEVGIVVEGSLRLVADGESLDVGPGDMVYFPKGAAVTYEARSKVRIACVNCIQ